jgi:hypothetical protein
MAESVSDVLFITMEVETNCSVHPKLVERMLSLIRIHDNRQKLLLSPPRTASSIELIDNSQKLLRSTLSADLARPIYRLRLCSFTMGRHPTTSGTSEQISTLPRGWSNRLLGLFLSVSFLLAPILFFQWPWQFSFGLSHHRLRIIADPVFAYKEWLWTSIYPILQRIQKTTLPSMRSILLTAFAFCAAVFSQNAAVDQFVATQYPISKAGVLANIGPSGSKSSGAKVYFCFHVNLTCF